MFISEKFILKYLFTITKVGTSLHALNFEVKIYFFSLQITLYYFPVLIVGYFFLSHTSIYWKNTIELQRQLCLLIKTWKQSTHTFQICFDKTHKYITFFNSLGKASIQPHILSFYIILSQYSHFPLSNPNIKHMT